MHDLISREQAIDAVKTYWKQQVDALDKHSGFETVTDACDAILKHNVGILNAIEQLPSAEPEIIRCEDCIKQDLCSWYRAGAKYCSYAERRTDE